MPIKYQLHLPCCHFNPMITGFDSCNVYNVSMFLGCHQLLFLIQAMFHIMFQILFQVLLPVLFQVLSLCSKSLFSLKCICYHTLTPRFYFSTLCVCDPFKDHGGVLFKKTTALFSQNDANSLMWFTGVHARSMY